MTQKEPVRYTNKLIKKTTDTNYREYLQLTKNLILATAAPAFRFTATHNGADSSSSNIASRVNKQMCIEKSVQQTVNSNFG